MKVATTGSFFRTGDLSGKTFICQQFFWYFEPFSLILSQHCFFILHTYLDCINNLMKRMPPIFYNPFYHLKVLFIAKTQNEEYISCEKNKSLTSKRLRDTGTMRGGCDSFGPEPI